MGQLFADRPFRARERRIRRLFHAAFFLQHDVRDCSYKVLEILVARNEIRFRIDFDNRAGLSVGANADQALGRNPAGFLRSGSQAVLPQEIDGCFNITVRLDQSLLTIHHARAGLIAQLFH